MRGVATQGLGLSLGGRRRVYIPALPSMPHCVRHLDRRGALSGSDPEAFAELSPAAPAAKTTRAPLASRRQRERPSCAAHHTCIWHAGPRSLRSPGAARRGAAAQAGPRLRARHAHPLGLPRRLPRRCGVHPHGPRRGLPAPRLGHTGRLPLGPRDVLRAGRALRLRRRRRASPPPRADSIAGKGCGWAEHRGSDLRGCVLRGSSRVGKSSKGGGSVAEPKSNTRGPEPCALRTPVVASRDKAWRAQVPTGSKL